VDAKYFEAEGGSYSRVVVVQNLFWAPFFGLRQADLLGEKTAASLDTSESSALGYLQHVKRRTCTNHCF
jgi:hypothetical protein